MTEAEIEPNGNYVVIHGNSKPPVKALKNKQTVTTQNKPPTAVAGKSNSVQNKSTSLAPKPPIPHQNSNQAKLNGVPKKSGRAASAPTVTSKGTKALERTMKRTNIPSRLPEKKPLPYDPIAVKS